MYVTHLSLHNFRNYARLDLELGPGLILLQGANAQGKSNLLEAFYYLATSRSPRTSADRQVIHWLASEDPLPYARLRAQVHRERGPLSIEIVLMPRPNEGNIRIQKQIKVNGTPRRAMDLLGQMPVVLFTPHDLVLVEGSPSNRRHYLDELLCQVDPEYCRHLSRYNRVLTQRNALLRRIRERLASPGELAFWDERLVEAGGYLILRRQVALQALIEWARPIHAALSGGKEVLSLRYLPSVSPGGEEITPSTLQATAQAFLDLLRERRQEEIQRALSLYGPHRDDVLILANEIDLRDYGSRGQQRTAVLAMKLAEVQYMAALHGDMPILLLDELLAELDLQRRAYLVGQLELVDQVVLTTSELDLIPAELLRRAMLFRVEEGRVGSLSSG